MNFTVTVPEGSTNHGNPKLVCTPPQATDYIIFFFTNYFAHAASIVTEPGQSSVRTGAVFLTALVLPVSGVLRAILFILRHAVTETKNPVKRAARACALCMVVRKPPEQTRSSEDAGHLGIKTEIGNELEKGIEVGPRTSATKVDPQGSDTVVEVPATDASNEAVTAIYGEQRFCEGFYSNYDLCLVPLTASLQFAFDVGKEDPLASQHGIPNPKAALALSHSLLGPFIGFIQAVWATITIYRARGDQVQEYGYAAFGLTVAPYAFMSLMNTLAHMLTPDYPSMFLIYTSVLKEAEDRKLASFKGVLYVEDETKHEEKGTGWQSWIRQAMASLDKFFFPQGDVDLKAPAMAAQVLLSLLFGSIPLAIVGGISGFHEGNSTLLERGFTISWLVVGICGAIMGSTSYGRPPQSDAELSQTELLLGIVTFLILYGSLFLLAAVPVAGGMVVVGIMIRESGICTLVG